jgi:hypothetical protein
MELTKSLTSPVEQIRGVTLYIKKCSHCSLLYFGKTVKNIDKYKGSGLKWAQHLAHHKSDAITILAKYYADVDRASRVALRFSARHKIATNALWANLKPEDAKAGFTVGAAQPWNKGHKKPGTGNALRGRKHPPRSEEWCQRLSASKKGKSNPKLATALTGRTSANKGKVAPRYLDVETGAIMSLANLRRWHPERVPYTVRI